jgi:hypothetical protein
MKAIGPGVISKQWSGVKQLAGVDQESGVKIKEGF